MGRKILFITTDQMRYDSIGCNGGKIARTPVIDRLATQGINYTRAHNQNVVCMPARATIATGQHVGTHGVWMNGVCLPEESPTIAHWLASHGYRTALLGKAHFEPWLGSADEFYENRMAGLGETGPHRGFEHMELANHFLEGHSHYNHFLKNEHPEVVSGMYPMVNEKGMQNTTGTGDTGAIQVWPTDIPRELYHTDWVAARTMAWLDTLSEDEDWFVWMSFPDPHHPWDPPASEKDRIDWREVPLPDLYPGSAEKVPAMLKDKPKHWMGYFDGSLWSNLEAPRGFKPCDLTPDQIREINAYNHIENELIDEACGRVLDYVQARGWENETDVIFTTDHGELQGDFGLLFKGPYHIDALMRLPLIWKPAPVTNTKSRVVSAPVGHVDLAQTFCEIAGIDEPEWVEGSKLPLTDEQAGEQGRARVMTQWDSEHGPIDIHLKSIYQDGFMCTVYEKSSLYDGSEGELYNLTEDPGALKNLWPDESFQGIKSDLIADLKDNLPPMRTPPLERKAPV
jgi:arylsulfatase A-like enzyme